MLSASVVVPTYQRPDYLERCVRSLLAQTRLPDEIILVSRDTDDATNRRIVELQQELGVRIPIRNPLVSSPGFLPPIQRGIEAAGMDIVAFLDDDAEAFPDWLERIEAHYADSSVGGVGGRCINYFDFKLVEYPPASKVGQLSWYGRSTGDMYKETTFSNPVPVDFFMGGNMSFRRSILQNVLVDPALNRNVGFYWELDLAQQIKHQGFRLLYDPVVKVNHYSAPRELDGLRTVNYDGVYFSNLNYMYLMCKHLSPLGRLAHVAYSFAVGWHRSCGILYLLVQFLRGNKIQWYDDILASLRGRIAGLRFYCSNRAA